MTLIGLLAFALAIVATLVSLDLRVTELVRAVVLLALVILPGGYLLTRGLAPPDTSRFERLALASLVGYPVAAAVYYFLSVAGTDALFPFFATAMAAAAIGVFLRTGRFRRSPPSQDADDAPRTDRSPRRSLDPATAGLLALLGLILLATTRDYRAFVPTPQGLAYNHSLEHSIHLAFIWEMLRGVPPQELPTAAGLPFPSYHVLAYMPAVILVRYGGLGVITAYHAVVPLLHLTLLASAVYLVVRIRSGRASTAVASLVALFFVVNALESAFKTESLLGRVTLEFFTRSVSGGGAIVVFGGICCLFALYEPGSSSAERTRPVYLAALLMGLLYGFKAQMFLLLGAAYFLALVAFYPRAGWRVSLGTAAVTLATSATLFLSWRSEGPLGTLAFVPGQLASDSGLSLMLGPWLGKLGWIPATPIALWMMMNFSLLFPAFTLRRLRSVRALAPLDTLVVTVLPVSLVLGYGLAAAEIEGETTSLVFREAFFAVQILTTVVDVTVLASLLDRLGRDGGKWVLAATGALALALGPLLLAHPTHRGASGLIVLSPAEQEALRYLREKTPLDAVVAASRTNSFPALSQEFRGFERVAVVAGLAGRRAVLEYYSARIDPRLDRKRDIRVLFSTRDAQRAERILERYRVDYVLEYAGLPLRFQSRRLEIVYDGGNVRLYRCRDGEEKPASGSLYSPGDLR